MVRSKSMTLYYVFGETCTELHGTRSVVEQSNSVSISKVVNDCVSAKKLANRRPSYTKTLAVYLKMFARGREEKPIAEFNLKTLEDWFASRNESHATRRGTISKLSVLFSFAKRRGLITENPCSRLERVTVDAKPPKILTPIEAEKLLRFMASNSKRRWRLPQVILGLFTGIRPAELSRLHWSDIDLDRAVVRVDACVSKVRQRRIVPVSPNAVEWLKTCQPNDKKIGVTRIKWVKQLKEETGVVWSQDLLRHCAASYLLGKHEDVGKVSRWLGNSPAVLLRHYCELVSKEDSVAYWSILP